MMTISLQTMSGSQDTRSFLKWVGGKARTASLLASLAPPGFSRYVEPFLGSGAVFFAVAPERALLGDLNEELIMCFQHVRDAPEEVMALLQAMPNTPEDFSRIRGQDSAQLSGLERAARVIYLNKTAFRGLWRVNRRGQFNVPYGAYDRPLFNPGTVRAASLALQAAKVNHANFDELLSAAEPGDWVYLDPPYVPAGGYSDFKRYTPSQFRADDHARLAELCRALDDRGIPFLLTNTNNAEARALYGGFDLHVLPTRRDVNLNKLKRASTDLLVANYDIAEALVAALGTQIPLDLAA
jgi:DNA adenine methylase